MKNHSQLTNGLHGRFLNIPERVIQGETVDDWYPLSGKQGDLAEGQGQVHHIARTSGLLLVNFRSNDEPQK